MGSAAGEEVTGAKHVPLDAIANDHDQESPLTPAEIERFSEQLEQLRGWLLESIAKIEQPANTTTNGNSHDGHDLVWQRTITQRALAEKRALLHEVVQAFERIEANTYGRCMADNVWLPRTLLEDVPWARFCSSCASKFA